MNRRGPSLSARSSASALLALLCAACGGGGGGAAAPTPTPEPPPQPAPPTGPNRAPVLVGAIDAQRARGGRTFTLDVSRVFEDPDGEPLSIGASSTPAAVGVAASGHGVAGVLPPEGTVTVTVQARDPRGGTAETSFTIEIVPNSPPVAASPNYAVYVQPGSFFSYDSTKAGSTFTDPDGDPLTYELSLRSPPRGLGLSGAHVVGALGGVGVVYFELRATDDLGASAVDRFAIAVAAPEPPEPVLPQNSYVYADHELPLPLLFAVSAALPPGAFWDTQPEDNRTTNAGATLGRVLFYDRRLSVTNTHSCGSCHRQTNGFASPERVDTGVLGVPLQRNSMALSNVRFNIAERWFSDLRAAPLEALALMPIEEPTELGSFLPQLEAKLAATGFYPPLFEAAFGDATVTSERIAAALAQFLRSLTSYRSKFDTVYHGDFPLESLLTPQELRGRVLFTSEQPCHFCHVTGVQTMIGALGNGLDAAITDPGVITLEGPSGQFHAPSLRNIAASAPYMHDGRFGTLREVVDHYDRGVQDVRSLGPELREDLSWFRPPRRLNLSDDDKQALEAFLHTLTDDAFLTDPKLANPFP